MLEQSVGEWLESIGLQQYESKLLLNGFDDVRFLVSAQWDARALTNVLAKPGCVIDTPSAAEHIWFCSPAKQSWGHIEGCTEATNGGCVGSGSFIFIQVLEFFYYNSICSAPKSLLSNSLQE